MEKDDITLCVSLLFWTHAFSNEFFHVPVLRQMCIKFQPNENHIHCSGISFFKTLATAIKHSSFSHALIVKFIVALIANHHA